MAVVSTDCSLAQSYACFVLTPVQILKRGAAPLGGGEVLVRCPILPALKPVKLLDEGLIKRIRGIAYVVPRVSHHVV